MSTIVFLAGAAAALSILKPSLALGIAIGVWCLVALSALPSEFSVAAPMLVVLLLPADQVAGLNGPAQGAFVAAVALAALGSLAFRRWRPAVALRDWDVLLLAGAVCGATLLHSGAGELRGVLFWASGMGFLIWLRSGEASRVPVGRQVAIATIAAGAVSGLAAALEYAGLLDLRSIFGAYRPDALEFSSALGLRAVGLSGHPLRLGTLTMVSSALAVAWLLDRGRPRRGRAVLAAALACSLVGLILSGARGAWVGFLAAGLAILALRLLRGRRREAWRVLAYLAIIAVLVLVTGLGEIVYERAFGSAFHAVSIGQRIEALTGVLATWRQLPIFGVGFGGTSNVTAVIGLRTPNLENEYLRVFLTAGFLGLLSLIVVNARRIVTAGRTADSPIRTGAFMAMVALSVNLATYNTFSWSAGPALFFAIAFLALPKGTEPPSIDLAVKTAS